MYAIVNWINFEKDDNTSWMRGRAAGQDGRKTVNTTLEWKSHAEPPSRVSQLFYQHSPIFFGAISFSVASVGGQCSFVISFTSLCKNENCKIKVEAQFLKGRRGLLTRPDFDVSWLDRRHWDVGRDKILHLGHKEKGVDQKCTFDAATRPVFTWLPPLIGWWLQPKAWSGECAKNKCNTFRSSRVPSWMEWCRISHHARRQKAAK